MILPTWKGRPGWPRAVRREEEVLPGGDHVESCGLGLRV